MELVSLLLEHMAVAVAAVILNLEHSMKTYPVTDANGMQIAFEIENIYIGSKSIVDLLCVLGEIKNIRMRKPFTNSEYRIKFEYNGVDCVVWEPFGDNSRYWIGPENPEANKIDVKKVQTVFDTYHPNALRKVLGDLLSLKFVWR
jgi:hypothetical protein